jgi:methyl-accepting chemotaxis protein
MRAPTARSFESRRDIGSVVKATGVIKPRIGAEVRVGSRISGVVQRLYVQIGDTVRKGQLLAQLDERDLVARRDEAAAALQQAEVNLAYARSDVQRKRALAAGGNLSPSDLEVAERAVAVAEQQVTGARASLVYATTQVGYARIIAPIAGVVATVSTQRGETVAASFAAPTFLTLIDPSRLEVWAYVDETDIGNIRTGQEAQFTVDTYGDDGHLLLQPKYFVFPAPKGGTYLFAWNFSERVQVAHAVLLLLLLLVIVAVVLTTHAVLRRLLRPLRVLSDGVARLSEGQLDVTLPNGARDEFGRLTGAFNGMVGRVGEMIRARDQLLVDVSHELRSPLTRMKVALELPPNDEQRSRLADDVAEMERMVA